MKAGKVLRWFGVVLGAIALLLVLGLVYVQAVYLPGPDVSAAAYSWRKGISDEEVDQIARQVLSEMTLEERIGEMSGDGIAPFLLSFALRGHFGKVYAGGVARLEVPPVVFTDGPRGVTVARSTSFPVSMARAATWDIVLESRVGDAIGKEVRAAGANYFGGLCINLLRHPSWGRAQESYGEDPWLMGEMAVALMKAVQHHNVMACAKHYALNSIENSRYVVDVELDERTLREVYLPHFRKCVDNGLASVMSAYNRVRGEYCGHNRYLLTTILRDEWGFQGFVTSDWVQGLRDGLKGMRAGLDIEMPMANHYRAANLKKLLADQSITESDLDAAVLRILRTKLRYVTREDPMAYGEELIASTAHAELAREVAEKSMVLLKNQGAILPLSRENVGSLAVVGRLADVDNTGDSVSSKVNPPYLVTPLQGLKNYLGEEVVVFAPRNAGLEAVRSAAGQADTVLVVVGVAQDEEGEFIDLEGDMRKPGEKVAFLGIGPGGDRVPLSLVEEDVRTIETACSTNPRCVVALIGGSAITMEGWIEQVPSVLMARYSGMEGGNALARVLFGDVNPSGKLPFTIPKDESQLPSFEPYAERVEYGYYHGYTLVDKEGYEAAFPFGYGLSYTTFAYRDLQVLTPEVTPDGVLALTVQLENTGSVAGEEVAQLYVGFGNSSVDRPVKLLRGFRKVRLQPGESRTVRFEVPVGELAWYNPEERLWEVERMQHEVLVGPSSLRESLLEGTFTVIHADGPGD